MVPSAFLAMWGYGNLVRGHLIHWMKCQLIQDTVALLSTMVTVLAIFPFSVLYNKMGISITLWWGCYKYRSDVLRKWWHWHPSHLKTQARGVRDPSYGVSFFFFLFPTSGSIGSIFTVWREKLYGIFRRYPLPLDEGLYWSRLHLFYRCPGVGLSPRFLGCPKFPFRVPGYLACLDKWQPGLWQINHFLFLRCSTLSVGASWILSTSIAKGSLGGGHPCPWLWGIMLSPPAPSPFR